MAAARVQYALERTLPSLTSLEAQGLFTRAELRALTHQRSVFEASLVRRNVERRDFEAYLTFEARFEALRELRVKRLPEPLPPSDAARARAEAAARSIAIWERGVKRLRGDVVFWHAYLRWVREKKMRVVAARVAARALALHLNVPALWIESADHELHANAAPAAARALLQRAIRLNARPHNALGEAGVRPTKRLRTESGAASADAPPPPPPPPATRLAPKEAQLVALWLEYVRMELVFLERLRRRWAVLGIAGKGAAAHGKKAVADVEAGAGAAAEGAEEEAAVLGSVPTADADEEAAPAPEAAANPAASIVAGAIPLSILSGALDLQSPTSLPPSTHFAFLLALASMVRAFPFLPFDAEEAGQDVRENLLGAIEAAFAARFPEHAVAALWRAGRAVLDTAIPSLDTEEERETSAALLRDGKLLAEGAEERLAALLALPQAQGSDSQRATSLIVSHLSSAFTTSPLTTPLPLVARTTLDALQSTLTARPSPPLFSAALDLIHALGSSARSDAPLRAFLEAMARRFVALAKRSGAQCERAVAADAVALGFEALKQGQADEEAWKKLLKEASKASTLLLSSEAAERNGPKLTALLLTRVEVRQGLARAKGEAREPVEKEWDAVLRLAKEEGVDERLLYAAWCAWVGEVVDEGAKEESKWARGVMEAAIRATRPLPAAHDVVVLTYLRRALCAWDAQFAFIRAHARSSDAVWSFVLSSARAAAGLAPSEGEGEKEWKNVEPHHQTRLEGLHKYLGTKEDASAAQRFAYIRFLFADKADVAAALAALRTACREVGEGEKREIEEAWEKLCEGKEVEDPESESEDEVDFQMERQEEEE